MTGSNEACIKDMLAMPVVDVDLIVGGDDCSAVYIEAHENKNTLGGSVSTTRHLSG